ncbi:uncharacterized protein LOC121740624 [Aricia agestis]|uniref:uncharacterized protein LOC121740624 n=1 Tax=Aricia agestis TaxID=91739 RepID=UPI001C20A583|nr:uncharacterized protein LOC121740624 [Aricia agestis]
MNFKSSSIRYNVEKYELWFIRTVRKLNSFTTLHAGFFVCFVYVPFVFSVTDIESRRVTFKEYNNTRHAQTYGKNTPYDASDRPYYSYSAEDTKENNVYRVDDEISSKEQLLVGFAHDPFGLSIPEADYRNGMREIDPKQYKADRGKRGVVHLYNMLLCASGCDPLSYQGYGCYCGFLGKGRPTDAIDNCCKLHDECYSRISCPVYTVYLQPYYWSCNWGEPQCSVKNYRIGCAARLCECDRRLAKCVQRYSCPRRGHRPYCRASPLSLLQNLLAFD